MIVTIPEARNLNIRLMHREFSERESRSPGRTDRSNTVKVCLGVEKWDDTEKEVFWKISPLRCWCVWMVVVWGDFCGDTRVFHAEKELRKAVK